MDGIHILTFIIFGWLLNLSSLSLLSNILLQHNTVIKLDQLELCSSPYGPFCVYAYSKGHWYLSKLNENHSVVVNSLWCFEKLHGFVGLRQWRILLVFGLNFREDNSQNITWPCRLIEQPLLPSITMTRFHVKFFLYCVGGWRWKFIQDKILSPYSDEPHGSDVRGQS